MLKQPSYHPRKQNDTAKTSLCSAGWEESPFKKGTSYTQSVTASYNQPLYFAKRQRRESRFRY